MGKRVVISGMGIIAPNANGIQDFIFALKEAKSGIEHLQELNDFNFVCKLGGVPRIENSKLYHYIEKYQLSEADLSIKYAILAGIEAWIDTGFEVPEFDNQQTHDDFGAIIGTCFTGYEVFMRKIQPKVQSKSIRRLGSQLVEQWMMSGCAANLSNILALSNINATNSSACSTGTEAIVYAYERIKQGKAKLILAGGSDPYSPYCWAGFDSMRLLCRNQYENPTQASRPMSASASGFVPSAGAGILVVEELEHAIKRNATIYAEIVGGEVNAGGQRNGGTMTYPNPIRVIDCIQSTLNQANIKGEDIDLISGHLTGTKADKLEIINWIEALSLKNKFPYINAPKSLFGHLIGAAGAVETIASALQINDGFIHPNINCEDLHPDVEKIYPREKISMHLIENKDINYVAKASFGFGDVNSCLILKKYV
ncbi:MAG: beta-ketoacyl-[acyl-carrier-protein] synthase family protein [Bacteroidales bacterium]|jgi:3-oxoacyl-(acyl-carrier-protein) synthase